MERADEQERALTVVRKTVLEGSLHSELVSKIGQSQNAYQSSNFYAGKHSPNVSFTATHSWGNGQWSTTGPLTKAGHSRQL